ncbi:three-Cys-motif partner protein TcmP [Mariniblastus sp.]|nr:three-Cys-motif partner protein TcmP [Mariniblastus sp.]
MNDDRLLPGMKPFVELKPKAGGAKPDKKGRLYLWDPKEPPPVLGKHSIAKHRILRTYLEKYVSILAAKPVQDSFRVSLVDGFSGGGVYRDPESNDTISGSPLLMVEAMNAAEESGNEWRDKQFKLNADFYFIEKDKVTFDYLGEQLKQNRDAHKRMDNIHLLNGGFSRELDRVIKDIKKKGRANRAIFLLDQYGYKDVTLANMRKIFRELPNAEIILTFAIDWFADFINETDRFETALRNLELVDKKAELLQLRQKHSSDWRPAVQHVLHNHFFTKSGAKFYTPFFIHSADSHRAYWLLHFSRHSKARDVMMQLHWEMENHFQHFGGCGFGKSGMLGYDPRQDIERPLLPYEFDSLAAEQTNEALLETLPQRISRLKRDITFGDFCDAVANETPATKQMLGQNISDLTCENELVIYSSDGRRRRNGVKIAPDDVIVVPRQKLLLPRSN